MKAEVAHKRHNPLMKRDEVEVSIDHSGSPTPKREQILEELVKLLGADKDAIIVDKIHTLTGQQASRAKVIVYKNAKDVPQARADKMKGRLGLLAKKPKAGAAAQKKE